MEIDEKELMLQRAVFGKEVDQFMASRIGQYLLSRADDERENAQKLFLSCDPSDVVQVTSIRNAIVLANSIEGWLRDAVGDGLRALEILEDRE